MTNDNVNLDNDNVKEKSFRLHDPSGAVFKMLAAESSKS